MILLRVGFALAIAASCPPLFATRVSAHNAGSMPRFEPAQCPQLAPQLSNARCGYLVVPEDRNRPLERIIRNFVAIIPARSADKASDPIV